VALGWLAAILTQIGSVIGLGTRPLMPTAHLPAATSKRFRGNFLSWPVDRASRAFRIYVVEPGNYQPNVHATVFGQALSHVIAPPPEPLELNTAIDRPARSLPFDLMTFPEAFLPGEELVKILNSMPRTVSFGCVHVGLRPSDADQHLFQATELQDLVRSLRTVPDLQTEDLANFSQWLNDQASEHYFNVGCFFTIDASRRLRVCLHPKLVPSKSELSPLPEQNMAEADLVTLITLQPTDPTFFTVNIQPLLCSDVLHLPTKRLAAWPLEALNRDASSFEGPIPDHIDIVSVATCTRQQMDTIGKGTDLRAWHQRFRESFIRAAEDDSLARHHHSVFVLANFRTVPVTEPGGLSGAFIPIPIASGKYPDILSLHIWGKPNLRQGGDNRWYRPEQDTGNGSSRGYIASLAPEHPKVQAADIMLGFTVNRLPRDSSTWEPSRGLIDFQHLALAE
jgi:hypothetical protein